MMSYVPFKTIMNLAARSSVEISTSVPMELMVAHPIKTVTTRIHFSDVALRHGSAIVTVQPAIIIRIADVIQFTAKLVMSSTPMATTVLTQTSVRMASVVALNIVSTPRAPFTVSPVHLDTKKWATNVLTLMSVIMAMPRAATRATA